jgi:putative aldouronate transport system substrate-binding protein
MKKLRTISLLLSVLLLFALFAACNTPSDEGGDVTPTKTPSTPTPTPAASEEPTGEIEEDVFTYPLDNDELTYWYPLYPEILAHISDWNEKNYAWIEGEKRTGIHINWITPNVQQLNEMFNIMIVSGDLPDMILSADSYAGGGEAAVNDGVYVRLNEYIEENTPAYNEWLASYEGYYKDTRTDSGLVYAIYGLVDTERKAGGGLVWRQDLAAKIGWTEAPTTITEFDQFLYDYKSATGQKGFFSPPQYGFITDGTYGMLPTSFGAATRMVNVDGTVQYGPAMPGFKDYIIKMKQWYDDEIIDPDFVTTPYFMTWSEVALGKFVVAHGVPGIVGNEWGGNYNDDPEMYIAAIRPLDGEGGIKASCGTYMTTHVGAPTAISTDSTKVETALRWLDFWYTEEGAMLKCYGVVGETFNYADGVPVWTDLIAANEQVVIAQAAGGVFINTFTGPGFQYCIYDNEDVEIACNVWADFNPSWNMPPIAMTADENTTYSNLMTDIETFCAETIANYITGARSLDDYESYFLAQLEKMEIAKAIEIQQAALDRYIKR